MVEKTYMGNFRYVCVIYFPLLFKFKTRILREFWYSSFWRGSGWLGYCFLLEEELFATHTKNALPSRHSIAAVRRAVPYLGIDPPHVQEVRL